MSDQNTIDRYILGQMTSSEREDFEKLLEQDDQLREQVELESLVADGILAANLRSEMQKLSERKEEKKTGARIISMNRFRVIAIAASVAILAVFFWQNQSGTSSVSFDGIYTTDAGLPVVMGEIEDKQFAEAMIAYKEGEYNAAASAFDNLCRTQSNLQSCYYYVQTLIHDQKWEEAREQLTGLRNRAGVDLKDKLDWHLSFVLFQLDDDGHLQILEEIADNSNHSFQKEAQEVLGK